MMLSVISILYFYVLKNKEIRQNFVKSKDVLIETTITNIL